MAEFHYLNEINPGQTARIQKLRDPGSIRRRLLDLGLTQQTLIQCVGKSPSGDPAAFLVRGSVIALRACDSKNILIDKPSAGEFRIALVGNPNVGKSTLFNSLTGMNQHTGNWPGKTVAIASGTFQTPRHTYILTDIPGTYSLMAHSPEEEVARDFLCFSGGDAALVVCDATCLERNLNLVLQTIELTPRVLVCVNLMDAAAHRNIHVDLKKLSQALGVPVIGTVAHQKQSLYELTAALDDLMDSPATAPGYPVTYPPELEAALQILEPVIHKEACGKLSARWLSLHLLTQDTRLESNINDFLGIRLRALPPVASALQEAEALLSAANISISQLPELITSGLVQKAEALFQKSVNMDFGQSHQLDRRLDRFFTGRRSGYFVMILLLILIFWITITGSNYPSQWLSSLLLSLEEPFIRLLSHLHAPQWFREALVFGAYRCLAWVISVMLPPMAIFFPLFTLLEDSGYLPRIAYNLDHFFLRCHACGKQALTMCMGFGCNAVGVSGCRIIDSPRERLIAVLTNCLVPCNGRFPALLVLISLFFVPAFTSGFLFSALFLTAAILLAIGMTFAASWFLSKTFFKGLPSAFTLELPPYRKPQFRKVLIRSLLDRTFSVLGRAVRVAVPAGILIWFLANVPVQGQSLLRIFADFLDPIARLFGLDGVIFLAFILGWPANEIVFPIMLMTYLEQGVLTELTDLESFRGVLLANGWTFSTALCTFLFTLFHWPCAATLITIHKETGSRKWTLAAFLLPTVIGLGLCLLVTFCTRLFL